MHMASSSVQGLLHALQMKFAAYNHCCLCYRLSKPFDAQCLGLVFYNALGVWLQSCLETFLGIVHVHSQLIIRRCMTLQRAHLRAEPCAQGPGMSAKPFVVRCAAGAPLSGFFRFLLFCEPQTPAMLSMWCKGITSLNLSHDDLY